MVTNILKELLPLVSSGMMHCFSKILIFMYLSGWCHKPEDHIGNVGFHENVKHYMAFLCTEAEYSIICSILVVVACS